MTSETNPGLREPGEHRLGAWIVAPIGRRIREEGPTQIEAAGRVGLHRPGRSTMPHGRLTGCSAERLACALAALGGEVRLTMRSPGGAGDGFAPGAA